MRAVKAIFVETNKLANSQQPGIVFHTLRQIVISHYLQYTRHLFGKHPVNGQFTCLPHLQGLESCQLNVFLHYKTEATTFVAEVPYPTANQLSELILVKSGSLLTIYFPFVYLILISSLTLGTGTEPLIITVVVESGALVTRELKGYYWCSGERQIC